MKEITESDALSRLSSQCAATEYCRTDVEEKMRRWGLPYDASTRVANRLESEGFVDNERYAAAFIRDKYRFAKWGRVKIAQALQLKKIPSHIYRPLLASIDADEYQSILTSLLQGKLKSVHADNDYERNAKLMRFAFSRGYEIDDIRRCMEAMAVPFDSEIENGAELQESVI